MGDFKIPFYIESVTKFIIVTFLSWIELEVLMYLILVMFSNRVSDVMSIPLNTVDTNVS